MQFDDKPVETVGVTTLAVANGKFFGGGMKVAPDADVSDGLFDVTIWTGYGLSDFVFKSAGVYSGEHVKWAGTRTLRCKKMTAKSDDEGAHRLRRRAAGDCRADDGAARGDSAGGDSDRRCWQPTATTNPRSFSSALSNVATRSHPWASACPRTR